MMNMKFEDLPHLLSTLKEDIIEIKELLREKQVPSKVQPKRVLMGVNEVCQITGKAKATIYALVQKRIIPSYKRGKRLYFYEDEILAWIDGGKRKALQEFHEACDNEVRDF